MNTNVHKHGTARQMAMSFSFVCIKKNVHTAFSELILYTTQTVDGCDVKFQVLHLIFMCTLNLLQINEILKVQVLCCKKRIDFIDST